MSAMHEHAMGDMSSARAANVRAALDRAHIFQEIALEREAQDAKWGPQNHPVPSPVETAQSRREDEEIVKALCNGRASDGHLSWTDILREEVEEASAAQTEAEARVELVQVAAVAIAAIEAIDRRAAQAAREALANPGC